MTTAWIQVFILTFAECVAPAGKTVCQEQQFELQFVSRADCEYALQQLIAAKDSSDRIIIDRQKTGCVPTAIEVETYANLDAVDGSLGNTADWRDPNEVENRRQAVNSNHKDRLASLMDCEETSFVAPCRVGDIIVEDATGERVEVWKQEQ